MIAEPFLAPSTDHLFGTDDLGRDLFTAVLFGARTSLVTGGAVAALFLALGLAVGITSGFVGGWLDDVLIRTTELFQVIPRFFLAIIVVAFFGNSLVNLILVLALTSWGGLARIARAEVLSLREREFVRAAVALGVEPHWIMLRHILPHASKSIVRTTALIVSSAILTEAGLSYLGLGDPNMISWGYLLNNAQSFLFHAWWLSVFPGLAIVVTILGLSFILDSLGSA